MRTQDSKEIFVQPERALARFRFRGLEEKRAPSIGIVCDPGATQLLKDADRASIKVDRRPGQAEQLALAHAQIDR